MSKETENPPAFPHRYMRKKKWVNNLGVSTRDYFAAKHAASITRATFEMDGDQYIEQVKVWLKKHGDLKVSDYIAKEAYALADAMLKERSKK